MKKDPYCGEDVRNCQITDKAIIRIFPSKITYSRFTL